MCFLFRRVAASPPKVPGGGTPRVSFLRRTWRALDRIRRSPVASRSLLVILVLLVLANFYLCNDWFERNYPKPPLGILTGELLKGFDRYSPEDNHSEEVLAEVFGPNVETHIQCVTPGCRWLEKEMHGIAARPSTAACGNFYSHVCGRSTERAASLHQRAAEDLMVAVVDHLLTASIENNDDDTAEHLRLIRKCVDGEEAMDFALTCDFSAWSTDSDLLCPDHYPLVPRAEAEIIFKMNSTTRPEELVDGIERSLQEGNASVTLEREGRKEPHIMTTQRVLSLCRWLADSARCHLRQLFKNDYEEDDVIRRYQRLWNELFFAPLSLSQKGAAMRELVGGGEAARKRVCAQIHEALFRAESAEAATAVLDGLTGGVRETIAELMEDAQHMLSERVPYWLSRHEEGESIRLQEKRRPAYLTQLKAVRAELAGLDEPSAGDYRRSIYSWKVSYDRARNVLTVPHGLMALMTEEMDAVEPATAVLLSAQLLQALLPRPAGPYSWKAPHDQHLAYVMECFRPVHNATLNVDGDAALLRELVYESALLGPLFDLYRKAFIGAFDLNVYLSKSYDNWQLFYVIWTMSRCGDPRGGAVVNAALSNSARFTRSFDCGMKDAMFLRKKCNFWVYW